MSPPAGAAAPAVHRGRVAAPDRPRVAPRTPRRVSGPSRGRARADRRAAQPERGLAVDVLAAARGLPRERLDRLIRGRSWIALIAFALIGIVALQLMLLKLNAGIGRSLAHESLLQRQNAALSIESSELAAGNRVETRAAALGMQLVPVSSLRFLAAGSHTDAARAAAALRARASTSTSEQAGAGASGGVTGVEAGAEATRAPGAAAATSSSSSSSTTTSSESSAATTGEAAPASESNPTAGAPPSGAPSSVGAPAGGAAIAGGAAEAASAGGEGAGQTGGAG